jgi:hypothetical protein
MTGCYTTQNYSDTPDKIFSGKSEIDLKGDYSLDSVSLRNKRTIPLKGYMTNYIERQKEKYLVYYYPKALFIDSALMKETNSKIPLYKKPVADTLNFNAIDSMYFAGSKFDKSYLILGGVMLGSIALAFVGFLVYSKPKFNKD